MNRVPWPRRPATWWGAALPIIAASALTLVAVPVVLTNPLMFLVVPAIAFAVLLVSKPWARLGWLVLGALAVFQTSEGLSAPKLVYLAGVGLAAVIALVRVVPRLREPWALPLRPSLVGAGILLAWIGLVSPVYSVTVRGIDPTMWARDAVTYLLPVAAVVIALDAAGSIRLSASRTFSVLVGGVSAVGFAAAWISSRGYSGEVSTERSLLASLVAITVPLALLFAMGLARKRVRPAWLVGAVGLLCAVLITGTRTGVVLPLMLIAMVGAARKARITLPRLVAGAAMSAASIGLILPFAAATFSSSTDVFARLSSISSTLTNGFQSDASGSIRLRAAAIAWERFVQYPLLGQGMGVQFPNPNPALQGVDGYFSLDTPVMFLAKFGLIGVVVLIIAYGLIVFAAARPPAKHVFTLESTVARGVAFVWLALLPVASVPEDKGFSVAIALLLLLSGSAARSLHLDGGGAELDATGTSRGSRAIPGRTSRSSLLASGEPAQ